MSVTIGSVVGYNFKSGTGLRSIDVTLSAPVTKGTPTTGKYLWVSLGCYGTVGDGIVAQISDNAPVGGPYFEPNRDLNFSSENPGYGFNNQPSRRFLNYPYIVLNDLSAGDVLSIYLPDSPAPLTTSIDQLYVRLHEVSGFRYTSSGNIQGGTAGLSTPGYSTSPHTDFSGTGAKLTDMVQYYLFSGGVGTTISVEAAADADVPATYSFDFDGYGRLGYNFQSGSFGKTGIKGKSSSNQIGTQGWNYMDSGSGLPYPTQPSGLYFNTRHRMGNSFDSPELSNSKTYFHNCSFRVGHSF